VKHTVVALMEDKPGVLNRVVNMFSRRAFNIESLTVGHTELPHVSRMTVVVDGTTNDVEQVVKQLYKVIDVLKVSDLTEDKSILRDLTLMKVSSNRETRGEIVQIAQIVGAQVVDLAHDSVILQIAAEEEKIDDFVRLMRPFGIKEMVRTGRVAMARGALNVERAPDLAELAAHQHHRRVDGVRRDTGKKKVAVDLTGEAG